MGTKLAGAIGVAAVATLAFVGTASARALTEVVNVRFASEVVVAVPCALDGLGEEVRLVGTGHLVIVTTTNPGTGNTHVVIHANSQGLEGVGLASGDRYRGVSVNNEHRVDGLGQGARSSVLVQTNRFIGPGPDNDFIVRDKLVIVLDATGDVVVDRREMTVDCT